MLLAMNMVLALHVIGDFRRGLRKYIQKDIGQIIRRI